MKDRKDVLNTLMHTTGFVWVVGLPVFWLISGDLKTGAINTGIIWVMSLVQDLWRNRAKL